MDTTFNSTFLEVLIQQHSSYPHGFSLLQASAGDKDWWKNAASIYDFTVKDIDGNDVCLDKYK